MSTIGPLRPPGAPGHAPTPAQPPEHLMAPAAGSLPEHLMAPATPLAPAPSGPPVAPPTARERSTVANVLFLLAGALAALMAVTTGLGQGAADGAEQVGKVIGTFLAVFGLPALARTVDIHVVRRRAGLPFWTPWILVMACALAFLARAGQTGEATRQPTVPDVVGLRADTAWQRLEEAGVRMGGVRPTDPSLYICTQTAGPTVQLRVGGPECASATAS